MVKTKGPSLATAASGSIHNLLTHSNQKGTSYVKRKSFPTNNRQATQLAPRAGIKFLTQEWSDLTLDQQLTWQPPPTKNPLPAYNHYLSENVLRIIDGHAPTKEKPAAPNTYLAKAAAQSFTTFRKRVLLTWIATSIMDHWSTLVYRSLTTPFDPTPDHLVGIVHTQDPPGRTSFEDHPPSAPVLYYVFVLGDEFGNKGPATSPIFVPWH